MTAAVSIRNVTRLFSRFTALDNVSLEIAAGEFIVLLGPSGCGKTTLLSILGGFLPPSSGAVMIADRDMTFVAPAQRPTTTMFQDYALFPHMCLRDNVGFGLRMRGMRRAERYEKAFRFLDLVGLRASSANKPHELSGGQRQRVALARALAVDPDVLLLDEPLGALDLKLRRQMQDELKAIQRRVGTTFIHVTHDQEEAMAIADRIVVMNAGRIEDVGRPADIYMRPKSLFSAGFMGEVNFIDATLVARDQDDFLVETMLGRLVLPIAAFTAGRPMIGDRVRLVIRPEHFRASSEGSASSVPLGEARITASAFFGTHLRCHITPVAAPEMSLLAHMPQSAKIEDGGLVPLGVNTTDVVALPVKAEG